MEFCPVQNSLYVQILRSRILAALLYVTRAVGVTKTLRRGIFERQGCHPVRHLTVELSSLSSIDYLPWTNYCVKLEVGLQVTSPFIIQGVAKFVKSIVTPTVPLFDPR